MNKVPNLLKKLMDYEKSDFYPFHMPGHKRQNKELFSKKFPNPFSIDITEIDGFDNLHHPEGILKESMEWASGIYGSDKTYYLVNGSSCGILSAISGTVLNGGTILMSRNCHKSAYHGVFLNQLKTEYVYPQMIPEFNLQGGYIPEKTEEMLKSHPDIQAVLVVSPTYDGIVSDIKAISGIVHKFHIPLIVDEAHGAHFSYGCNSGFPKSALQLGADVVIQSLHKTLPSFTQTALMHVREGYVDTGRLDRYVHMYQSSSPSYVLMAGIENCIRYMSEEGINQMRLFHERIVNLRKKLSELECLQILTDQVKGTQGVYDLDISKIVVSTKKAGISGVQLGDWLRKEFHLEMEMCRPDSIMAITTLADTGEGLDRLCSALLKIDADLQKREKYTHTSGFFMDMMMEPERHLTLAQAMDAPRHKVAIPNGEGMVSTEFIYAYPPGIPIIAPGEVLKKETIEMIIKYKELGLSIQGMEDENAQMLYVVEERDRSR